MQEENVKKLSVGSMRTLCPRDPASLIPRGNRKNQTIIVNKLEGNCQ